MYSWGGVGSWAEQCLSTRIPTSQTSTAPAAARAVIAVPKSCKNVRNEVDVLPGLCCDDTPHLWHVMKPSQTTTRSSCGTVLLPYHSGGSGWLFLPVFFHTPPKNPPSLPPDNELNCAAEMVAVIHTITHNGPFHIFQDWWRFPDPGASDLQRQ